MPSPFTDDAIRRQFQQIHDEFVRRQREAVAAHAQTVKTTESMVDMLRNAGMLGGASSLGTAPAMAARNPATLGSKTGMTFRGIVVPDVLVPVLEYGRAHYRNAHDMPTSTRVPLDRMLGLFVQSGMWGRWADAAEYLLHRNNLSAPIGQDRALLHATCMGLLGVIYGECLATPTNRKQVLANRLNKVRP